MKARLLLIAHKKQKKQNKNPHTKCSTLVLLSCFTPQPQYTGPGDIDLIFCLFGQAPSAGLVTDDKCIIKQQLSQLKLHIQNEMGAGVNVGVAA